MKASAKDLLRKLIFRIIRYLCIPFVFRNLIQKNRISILLFHDISAETATQTFNYLTKKYNIISLQDFLNAAEDEKNFRLPKKAMIITFDDGFQRNYELTDIFRKFKIPATIFICAGIANTNRHFWFEENNSSYSLSELLKMGNDKKLEILASSGFSPEKEYETPQSLSKKQINKMKAAVDFQSHTIFHPCLPKCSEEEARKEICESKKMLEKNLNLQINALAYPNGDYSERDILIAKDCGYQCGLTIDFGFNKTTSDLFRLKRFCVNDTDDMNELIVKASGFWDFLKTRNGKIKRFYETTY